MGVPLAAVAHDAHFLAFQSTQISVFVVVDFDRHCADSFPSRYLKAGYISAEHCAADGIK